MRPRAAIFRSCNQFVNRVLLFGRPMANLGVFARANRLEVIQSREFMPNCRKIGSPTPASIQLPLFGGRGPLAHRRAPETKRVGFYRMEVWPDLFGRALLLRQWGRIGTEGRRRLDPIPIPAPRFAI